MTMLGVGPPATERSQVPVVGPLTYGQLSAWRDAGRLSRARWHEANVFHTFDLPGSVTLLQLRPALDQLTAKHESLRTVYDVTDPAVPRQRVLPVEPIGTALTAIPLGSRRAAALQTELRERPFDLSTDRPFRVLALTQGTEIRRISFCLHHIACDGWSLGLLVMDLLALLGLDGEPLPPAPTSLIEVADEQRTAAIWQTKLRASQRHFQSVYQSEATSFRDRDPAAGVLQVAVESRRLRIAAEQLAASHKVSIASVFTTAFLGAVAALCNPGPVRIGLMSSNRFLERWRNQVTTMNQLVPMIAETDPARDFGERLAQIQVSTMRAYRLGLFDVDAVTPQALGLALDPAQVRPVCIFNIVNGADVEYPDPETQNSEPELHWEKAFNLVAAGCNLRAQLTFGGTVRLRLRTGELSADTTSAILLATYRQVVQHAAASPTSTPR
jgi:hypothetical protein